VLLKPLHAITFFAAIFFLSCGNNIKDVQFVNADKNTPDESMQGVTIVYTDYGTKRAIVKTPVIYSYGTQLGRKEFPKGLKVDFFTSEGVKESYLESGYAVLNEQTKQFVLEKDVKMINFKRKDTLETQYLIWKQDSGLVVTDKQVLIHGIKGTLTGNHFRAKENFTQYTWKNVKGAYFYNQTDSL
jgi:LPS export ABC transporter protein LptC